MDKNSKKSQEKVVSSKKKSKQSSVPFDNLISKGLDDWQETDQEVRVNFFTQLNKNFSAIVSEFFELSEYNAERFHKFSAAGKIWRIGLIVATGILAILNLLIATDIDLRILAAIYAALLTILSNLENFFNYGDNSQTSRNARESYLDAHREYDMLWNIHVRPYGETPSGCYNASILYRKIVKKDEELRSTVKEMTKKQKLKK